MNICLGAGELILGRLDLADGISLPALDAIELPEQLVLDAARARHFLGQDLHLARAFGDVGRDRLARHHELGIALLLLGHRRLVELDAADALVGGTDLRPEHVDLGDQRDEPRLQRVHVVELVLRVHHLLGEAVARRLERFELGAAHQLVLQLAIDVGAEGVEAVQPALERLDERDACRHARELRVELGDRFVEPGRLLRALLDERHLAEDGVHLRFELGRARWRVRSSARRTPRAPGDRRPACRGA